MKKYPFLTAFLITSIVTFLVGYLLFTSPILKQEKEILSDIEQRIQESRELETGEKIFVYDKYLDEE